jgi:hypothetical protein
MATLAPETMRFAAMSYIYRAAGGTMSQRRIDEHTGMTVEYALFLAETRGLKFALNYLESCNVPAEILLRTVQYPESKRRQERRQNPR